MHLFKIITTLIIFFSQLNCRNVADIKQQKPQLLSIHNCELADSIRIRTYDTLAIFFKNEIPGSGYLWKPVTYDPGIKYLGKSNSNSYSDVDYVGRTASFKFIVIGKGKMLIQFHNKRAGQNQAPKDSCNLQFKVE